jgi:hypothetical protein
VKIINGHANKAVVDFVNNEAEPVSVSLIAGALSSMQPLPEGTNPFMAIVRNLTVTRYDTLIPAGEKQSLPYSFTTDLHPQELRLNLVAVVNSQAGNVYQIQAFNETVSVVDPATSIFDPQMFVDHSPSPKTSANSDTVSSCTFSSSPPSPEPFTSYTRPGSRPCSPRLSVEARAASAPSAPRWAPRRLCRPMSRFLLLVLMDRLLQPVQILNRPTMRAGSQSTT